MKIGVDGKPVPDRKWKKKWNPRRLFLLKKTVLKPWEKTELEALQRQSDIQAGNVGGTFLGESSPVTVECV